MLTSTDGTELQVASKDAAPSVFTRSDGTELCTVRRGETSVAVAAGGSEILHFVPDPDEAKTVEAFRLLVMTPADEQLGRLDVIRTAGGWKLSRAVDAALDTLLWWDHAGQAMKVSILGTRLTLERTPTAVERDVLLGACVDLAIGLRPYIAAMS